MRGAMYVCLCNSLTDQQVRDAARAGVDRPSEVYRACGCSVQCGACARTMRSLIDEAAPLAAAGD
jgi:bacterioferritin-associated ferredoxin